MNTFTCFGRKKEDWEIYPAAFCERGGYLVGSPMCDAIFALSQEEFEEIAAVCDPEQDYLISVDSGGFAVNHGNVGSLGINYDF